MRAARVGARMAGMKRGHIHARSWDKAVAAMRAELRALPNYSRMTAAGRRTLAAVDALCAELTARRYLAWYSTNAELAKKYGVSPRTITAVPTCHRAPCKDRVRGRAYPREFPVIARKVRGRR